MDSRGTGFGGTGPCGTGFGGTGFSGPITLAVAALALTALAALLAGCGGSPGTQTARSTAKTKVTACGASKTAANVPVKVEITAGQVSCKTALGIEHKYAEAIRSGKVAGNGGGAPVKISGWTCQGYATPVVLHTGKASICVEGANKILAILSSPT